MSLNTTYFDHVIRMRQRIINAERSITVKSATHLMTTARFSLGLVLDLSNYPHNPYKRAHQIRARGKGNKKALNPLTEDAEEMRFHGSSVADLEMLRQELDNIAHLIHSSLYLPLGSMDLGHLADFVSRAHQDILLARCFVSVQLARMATETENDPDD